MQKYIADLIPTIVCLLLLRTNRGHQDGFFGLAQIQTAGAAHLRRNQNIAADESPERTQVL